MSGRSKVAIRTLGDEEIRRIVEEAKKILAQVGVLVDHHGAVAMLRDAGASLGTDGRLRITPAMVEAAVDSAPNEFALYDRDGTTRVPIGGDVVHFDPGSAVLQVLDHGTGQIRPATSRDCVSFARVTDALAAIGLQSTCLLPNDVPPERADLQRLRFAMQHCRKPVVTGAFAAGSFHRMRHMLVCLRGSEKALQLKPYAIFDCCASSPLRWAEVPCASLIACAQSGIPAELVSMPLTGATAPVTLLGAVTQHAAENLTGLVIHQLARSGAAVVYGGAPSAFDMRNGTNPMGAVETVLIDSAFSQVGKSLGLPTHAFMALSDAKTIDYQAGLESGMGALVAAMSGINVVSGPGMLAFASCQSLEKLVLDHEACRIALRAARGLQWRDGDELLEVVREGVAAARFLSLPHTHRWYRQELHFPGPTIDRHVLDTWLAAGATRAVDRAHGQVEEILAHHTVPPLPQSVDAALAELATG